jgi:uncharacterized damage-inducible protein DinB
MTESEVDRIVEELNREHSGDAWHGSPLLQILEGIDHEQAAARPLAEGHTIWEIVLHIIGWKSEVRRRLGGAPAGLPAEGDWPVPPTPTADAWQETREALDAAHHALVVAVSQIPQSRLHEPTNDPRDRVTGQGVSYYVLLHGIVQHDVYHAGQVALLKKGGARDSAVGARV